MRYPFNNDDGQGADLKHYCRAPHSVQEDAIVDQYPLGEVLDKFGPRDKYNKTEYKLLAKYTKDFGIILSETRVEYSESNMAMVPAFGSTLVTWRLHDQRRQDKVMFNFADIENHFSRKRAGKCSVAHSIP